jgi:putative ABC transport system substrate-binding protein
MKRRQFIALLGGGSLAARGAGAANHGGCWFLSPGSPEPSSFLVAAFREGLKEASYIEGKNISIEYRWARGNYDQLQTLAADLVRQQLARSNRRHHFGTGGKAATSTMSPALETKRLELLHELVPRPAIVAVLLNATNPGVGPQRRDIRAAATALGQELHFFYASNESDSETAFGALVQQRPSCRETRRSVPRQ